ncbi:MAG: AsmA family protein [Gammaproteobacteria bacterium]|nr:AsmA family protein [Gammaproteobacteria bacterium]
MAKLLKVLGIVVGAFVGLLVIALVGVALLFDPNDYKPEISAAVEDATGRTLTLEGDLELNVFPRLRIALGEAELSNAAGFGDAPFVSIQGARLQVGLLPLILLQSLEIDEARLDGLTLNLARNAQGQGNWEDMGQAAAAGDEDELIDDDEAVEGGQLTVAVQAIVVDDAQVNWTDATTGETWQLSEFNLELEDFGVGVVFPMQTSFALSGEEIAINLAAEMQATVDLDDNSYLLQDLIVDIDGSGAAWPGGEGALALQFDALEADLDAETVELSGLVLEFLDVVVRGNLSGAQLFSNLSLSGGVEIEDFDPQDIMDLFDVEIETADPDALERVGASAQLAYDSDRMMLEQMSLRLDDSTLTGSLGMQGETLSFDLAIDEFNADRYLPPAEDEPQAEEEGSLDEVDLPLEFLRGLDADGRFAIGALQFDGLSFSNFSLGVSADGGRVRLTPSAGLYGGTYAGTIGIDVQDTSALLTLNQQLAGVDVAVLMRDYLELDMFTGTLSLDTDVSASGANVGEVIRQLDGDVSFALIDGSWEGVDVWQQMRRARATFERDEAPAAPEGEPRTPFSSISASGILEDAVLTTDDLTASFEFMTIAGAGTVELLNDAMDLAVTASFTDSDLVLSDPLMADLAGDSLPLTATGSIAAPTVRPDFSAMVRAEVREAVDERVEEERQELEDRLQDRLRGLFDR